MSWAGREAQLKTITKSNFARECGVSAAAITKACRPGNLLTEALTEDGRLDLLLARRLWAQRKPVSASTTVPPPAPTTAGGEGVLPIQTSRAILAQVAAMSGCTKFLTNSGRLVESEPVSFALRSAIRMFQVKLDDGLSMLPSQMVGMDEGEMTLTLERFRERLLGGLVADLNENLRTAKSKLPVINLENTLGLD